METTIRRLGGVLGGMGPLATIDFLTKVVALTPTARDQDHVPLIVHQVPQIPDRSDAIVRGSDAPFVPMLTQLRKLALAGAEFAVIPCNTAHYWYERLARAQPLPILHIADAVRIELQTRGGAVDRVAILATRGTNRAGIYRGRLGARFEPVLSAEESAQKLLDEAIAAVKAGELGKASAAAHQAAHHMLDAGAAKLILACTELPLAFADSPLQEMCIDSTLALARRCVAESMRVDLPYATREDADTSWTSVGSRIS